MNTNINPNELGILKRNGNAPQLPHTSTPEGLGICFIKPGEKVTGHYITGKASLTPKEIMDGNISQVHYFTDPKTKVIKSNDGHGYDEFYKDENNETKYKKYKTSEGTLTFETISYIIVFITNPNGEYKIVLYVTQEFWDNIKPFSSKSNPKFPQNDPKFYEILNSFMELKENKKDDTDSSKRFNIPTTLAKEVKEITDSLFDNEGNLNNTESTYHISKKEEPYDNSFAPVSTPSQHESIENGYDNIKDVIAREFEKIEADTKRRIINANEQLSKEIEAQINSIYKKLELDIQNLKNEADKRINDLEREKDYKMVKIAYNENKTAADSKSETLKTIQEDAIHYVQSLIV